MGNLENIFRSARTIAVVGLSDKPERPSYVVAAYLQAHGYRIIPVNPMLREVLGERAFPDLRSIPEPIDIVDIFRKPEDVPGIVEDAISVKAKVVWMQEGVSHAEAQARAEGAGLIVVMNRCIRKDHEAIAAPRGEKPS
ncbi:MAG: CoA-binding protein [Planctomycetes bacterium RBG_16_59_8]|nr:MAG: CoA-binding protein [Planctomycetes bacterium RBG_16_59_8]